MTDASDLDCVRRCLEGERQAFAQLVEKYQQAVYNVAFRMVGNADEAEDVAQSAFVKAYENLGGFDAQYRFFSWLYRIAVNEALNAVKRRRQFEGLDESLPAEEADAGDVELNRRIQEGLMELPYDQRIVVILRHFQSLPYSEMGQILGISEKTVKSRLFSARAALRDILVRKGITAND